MAAAAGVRRVRRAFRCVRLRLLEPDVAVDCDLEYDTLSIAARLSMPRRQHERCPRELKWPWTLHQTLLTASYPPPSFMHTKVNSKPPEISPVA